MMITLNSVLTLLTLVALASIASSYSFERVRQDPFPTYENNYQPPGATCSHVLCGENADIDYQYSNITICNCRPGYTRRDGKCQAEKDACKTELPYRIFRESCEFEIRSRFERETIEIGDKCMGCPEGYELRRSICYQYFSSPQTYDAAVTSCQNQNIGAKLSEPGDRIYMFDMLNSMGIKLIDNKVNYFDVWFGISDVVSGNILKNGTKMELLYNVKKDYSKDAKRRYVCQVNPNIEVPAREKTCTMKETTITDLPKHFSTAKNCTNGDMMENKHVSMGTIETDCRDYCYANKNCLVITAQESGPPVDKCNLFNQECTAFTACNTGNCLGSIDKIYVRVCT